MAHFVAHSLDELQSIADALVPFIRKKSVVAFYGSMGVGKTTLIKAICKSMGVKSTVTSPTFALVNEYTTTQAETIYHFDFYRINKTDEIFDMGYEEYFYSGHFCFIEWPELASSVLTPDTLSIHIDVDKNGYRTISVEG